MKKNGKMNKMINIFCTGKQDLSNKMEIRYGKFLTVLFFTYAALFLFPLKIVPKNVPYSYALYDKIGTLLGASVASDGQWRFSPGTVPDKFAQAVIVFEDKRFYYHLGIDPIAVLRAVVSNIRAGRIVSGASTLTMQTMRLLAGNKPRTLLRKSGWEKRKSCRYMPLMRRSGEMSSALRLLLGGILTVRLLR